MLLFFPPPKPASVKKAGSWDSSGQVVEEVCENCPKVWEFFLGTPRTQEGFVDREAGWEEGSLMGEGVASVT